MIAIETTVFWIPTSVNLASLGNCLVVNNKKKSFYYKTKMEKPNII